MITFFLEIKISTSTWDCSLHKLCTNSALHQVSTAVEGGTCAGRSILLSSAQNFPCKFCELRLFRSQSVVNDKYSVNWHFSSYTNYQCILSLLSFINCGQRDNVPLRVNFLCLRIQCGHLIAVYRGLEIQFCWKVSAGTRQHIFNMAASIWRLTYGESISCGCGELFFVFL